MREFLEAEILPILDDHRLRFRTLVAMNALSIVEREAPGPTPADWATARRIRAGDIRDTDLAQLKAEVAAKLAIASPTFLEPLPDDADSAPPDLPHAPRRGRVLRRRRPPVIPETRCR